MFRQRTCSSKREVSVIEARVPPGAEEQPTGTCAASDLHDGIHLDVAHARRPWVRADRKLAPSGSESKSALFASGTTTANDSGRVEYENASGEANSASRRWGWKLPSAVSWGRAKLP